MKLHIKFMVSLRCKLLVKQEIENLGLHLTSIELGMIDILEIIDIEQRAQLKENLALSGLELMDDKKNILISNANG